MNELDTSKSDSLLNYIDSALVQKWKIGRNIILCWTGVQDGIDLLSVPYYQIGSLMADEYDDGQLNRQGPVQDESKFHIREIIKGSRYVSNSMFDQMLTQWGLNREHIELIDEADPDDAFIEAVDNLVSRYSISYVENRAVSLFDIVGFSKYSPFEQVTLLSSLSYSINAAYKKLLGQGIKVAFSRTTTGDGFYIWTREPTIEGNVNLYSLVQLVLADNAIARTRSYSHTSPVLKTAFHIGNYYEFYQSEALHPTPYSYIVGEITIELSRIIEKAMPGQILMGDFHCHLPSPDQPDEYIAVDTVDFINMLKEKIQSLKGVMISDRKINLIMCYLTGQRIDEDNFSISKYEITDKHNISRDVYNAKVNIYRDDMDPIFLGVQEKDMHLSELTRIR